MHLVEHSALNLHADAHSSAQSDAFFAAPPCVTVVELEAVVEREPDVEVVAFAGAPSMRESERRPQLVSLSIITSSMVSVLLRFTILLMLVVDILFHANRCHVSADGCWYTTSIRYLTLFVVTSLIIHNYHSIDGKFVIFFTSLYTV